MKDNKRSYIKALVPIIVTVILLLIPSPNGLVSNSWHFFALFIGVILGLIFEPLPPASIGFIGISLGAVFGLVHAPGATASAKGNISWALSGFSNTVVWIIFAAFMFSLAYKKTGLGKRISLLMIKYMGKSSLGLGYAISIADLILGPFIPSNTARSGGIIFPITSNIPPMFDSYPDKNPRKIGSYLTWVGIASDCVVSSMFLTSLAPTFLASSILAGLGVKLEWMKWFLTIGLICIPLFILVPLLTYWIYPPEIKKSPEVAKWAGEELKKLGKITSKEITLLILVLIALVLWIVGSKLFGMHSTTAAILVVSLLVVFNVLTWDDILGNKAGFNTFIWFATLVAMASGLSKSGFLKYLGDSVSSDLNGLSPNAIILSLAIIYVLLHYFFASTTAHVTALLAVFMTIGLGVIPQEMAYKFGIILTGSLGFMGIITPYATGCSPMWYGSGFISQKTWWLLGFIFMIIFFVVYLPLSMIIIR